MAPKKTAKAEAPGEAEKKISPEELEVWINVAVSSKTELVAAKNEIQDKDLAIESLQRKASAAEALVSKVNLLVDKVAADEQHTKDHEELQQREIHRLEGILAQTKDAEAKQAELNESQLKIVQRLQTTDELRSTEFVKLEERVAEMHTATAKAETDAKTELMLSRASDDHISHLEFEVRALERDRKAAMETIKLARFQFAEKRNAAAEATELAERNAFVADHEIDTLNAALAETSAGNDAVWDELRCETASCSKLRGECHREICALESELATSLSNHEASMEAVVHACQQQVKLADSQSIQRAPARLRQEVDDCQAEIRAAQRRQKREHVALRWVRLFIPMQTQSVLKQLRKEELVHYWAFVVRSATLNYVAKSSKEDIRLLKAVAQRWRMAALPSPTVIDSTSMSFSRTSPLPTLTLVSPFLSPPATPSPQRRAASGNLDESEEVRFEISARAAQLAYKSGFNVCFWSHLSVLLVQCQASKVRDERLRTLTSYALNSPRLECAASTEESFQPSVEDELKFLQQAWRWVDLCIRLAFQSNEQMRAKAVQAAATIAKYWRVRSLQFTGRAQRPAGAQLGPDSSASAATNASEARSLTMTQRWVRLVMVLDRAVCANVRRQTVLFANSKAMRTSEAIAQKGLTLDSEMQQEIEMLRQENLMKDDKLEELHRECASVLESVDIEAQEHDKVAKLRNPSSGGIAEPRHDVNQEAIALRMELRRFRERRAWMQIVNEAEFVDGTLEELGAASAVDKDEISELFHRCLRWWDRAAIAETVAQDARQLITEECSAALTLRQSLARAKKSESNAINAFGCEREEAQQCRRQLELLEERRQQTMGGSGVAHQLLHIELEREQAAYHRAEMSRKSEARECAEWRLQAQAAHHRAEMSFNNEARELAEWRQHSQAAQRKAEIDFKNEARLCAEWRQQAQAAQHKSESDVKHEAYDWRHHARGLQNHPQNDSDAVNRKSIQPKLAGTTSLVGTPSGGSQLVPGCQPRARPQSHRQSPQDDTIVLGLDSVELLDPCPSLHGSPPMHLALSQRSEGVPRLERPKLSLEGLSLSVLNSPSPSLKLDPVSPELTRDSASTAHGRPTPSPFTPALDDGVPTLRRPPIGELLSMAIASHGQRRACNLTPEQYWLEG